MPVSSCRPPAGVPRLCCRILLLNPCCVLLLYRNRASLVRNPAMVTAARAAGRKKARPEALQNCYRTIRKVLAWLQEGFYRVHTIPRHHVEPIRMAPGSGPLRSCCLGRGRARSPAFGPALTPQGSPHIWQDRQVVAGTLRRPKGLRPLERVR